MCQRPHVKGVDDFRASSLATLLQMVAAGRGYTLVPALVAQVESPRFPTLRFIPFKGFSPGRTIGLMYRPSSPRGPEYQMLRDELAQALVAAGITPG